MIEICRSYSRKLQLEHLGGRKYESADLFSSWKQSDLPDDLPKEEYDRISNDLFDNAKKDILCQVNKMQEDYEKIKNHPF